MRGPAVRSFGDGCYRVVHSGALRVTSLVPIRVVESQAVALFQRRTERNAFPNTDRNAGRNAEPNADCKHRAWRPSNDG
jgi:hypothetical protein